MGGAENGNMVGHMNDDQSSPESSLDNFAVPTESSPVQQAHGDADQTSPSSDKNGHSPTEQPKTPIPMQKRRRVTRACDECRRKKIKCDGKQPCTHCTVYSYDCTYDQPSNRRRNPAPQYIEALENRLHRAETLLKTVMPDIDLDNPDLDAGVPQRLHAPARTQGKSSDGADPSTTSTTSIKDEPDAGGGTESESLLESMVETTGQLDLDDQGYWDFHGHSSGLAFLRRMREQFGDLIGPEPRNTLFTKPRSLGQAFDTPKSLADSPMDPPPTSHTADLPSKEVAEELVSNALDDACAVMRFVHQPSFYALFDRIYNVAPDRYGNEEYKFLPLLYVVMALGCLFAKSKQGGPEQERYETAVDQGDLTSLQAVVFMTMFLQSSAKLSTCYSYVGIALRSSLRMGLHRSVASNINPIEREIRKRVFWVVFKMDTYVGALLGLPKTLSDEDIDQDFPIEIDDQYITKDSILSIPQGKISLYSAANAHTKILKILAKVIKYIYPIKGLEQHMQDRKAQSNVVSHARIRELEEDLQQWMDDLPMQLRTGGEPPPEVLRAQHLLRMAYAHVQMMLYRPFLHYVSQGASTQAIDKRSYACAAACVSVSRNIIHITSDMKRRSLLIGAYWFTMYTTFFAILSLVFFVLENPDNPGSPEILKDAVEGRDTLASLAKRSIAADRCTATLAVSLTRSIELTLVLTVLQNLFEQLPERLRRGRSKFASIQKKRHAPSPHSTSVLAQPVRYSNENLNPPDPSPGIVQRAGTFPLHFSDQGLSETLPATDEVPQPNGNLAFDSTTLSNLHKPSAQSGTTSGETPQSPNSSMPFAQEQPSQLDPQQARVDNDLADLSAVMFPSGDPFAYPNQPITTLESKQHEQDPRNGQVDTNGMFMPDVIPHNTYDDSSLPLYGQMPPYYVEGQQSDMNPPALAEGLEEPHFGLDPESALVQSPWNGPAPAINFEEILGAGGDEWNNMLMEQSLRR
ncbi:MAG: hypothetical protein M1837_004369 [Sclerophora amabilis]|nr:MAG: hypothetical protein M1837_004369 [Sclerophora amabilis]